MRVTRDEPLAPIRLVRPAHDARVGVDTLRRNIKVVRAMKMTEAHVEAALDYLQDNADAAAQARADRVYCTEYRKSLKALLMQNYDTGKNSSAQQERDAYADDKYVAHLEALKEGVVRHAKLQFLREANLAKIDAWQTKSANERNRVPY